jgi:hypothetical protein
MNQPGKVCMMNLKKTAVALGVGLSLVCAAAQAQTVMRFQDDDIDFLLDSNLNAKTSGAFAQGDVLVSVFEIPTFTVGGANGIPNGQELTGIAAIQITGGDGSLANPFTFSAYSGGFNAISPVDVVGGGAGGGATLAMWLNSTADFDLDIDFASAVGNAASCTSYANCLDRATGEGNGSLLQVDGFGGDADDFWTSTLAVLGGDDPSTVAGLAGDVLVASFQAAQTTLFNSLGPIVYRDIASGLPCPAGSSAQDGCVAGPVISGTITGGLGLNDGIRADGAFARSDLDASKLLQVPEPGSLALVGLSLLGLAAARRRTR